MTYVESLSRAHNFLIGSDALCLLKTPLSYAHSGWGRVRGPPEDTMTAKINPLQLQKGGESLVGMRDELHLSGAG